MSGTKSSARMRRREFFYSTTWLVIRLAVLAVIAVVAVSLAVMAFSGGRL